MPPEISVVIPAYNHERFLRETIDSVLGQSYENLELIIVDDGSTDKSAEVIRRYSDPRLCYIYQENQDSYNSLNRGLSLAKGSYIAILNSDDVYAQNRLQRLLEVQRQSGAQCLFTRVNLIDDKSISLADPALWWNRWYDDAVQRYLASGDLYTAFLQRNLMITTSNLFLTKEAVAKVGGFSPLRYLHDYDYIFRVLLAFPDQVRFLHEDVLLSYRIHASNTLSEAAITGREQDKTVIRKYMLARLPEGLQTLVAAGADRLVELENELMQERRLREEYALPGIRVQVKNLLRSCRAKLQKESGRIFMTAKKEK